MKYAAVLIYFSLGVSPVFAAPPSAMTLSYDTVKNSLHVSAAHPSDRLERHYLRRLTVYKNDEEAKTVFWARQKLPAGIEEDIDLNAVPGDHVRVEVFCSQGGFAKAEYIVPKNLKKK